MCIPISISNDNVVEATESFAVTLDSTDRAVGLISPFSPNVTIIDSTGKNLLSICYGCYCFKESLSKTSCSGYCVKLYTAPVIPLSFVPMEGKLGRGTWWWVVIITLYGINISSNCSCISLLHLTFLLFGFLWPLAEVQVGLSAPSFTACEANGSVPVCVNIFGAILTRSVTVSLSTWDDSASCEFAFVLAVYCIFCLPMY